MTQTDLARALRSDYGLPFHQQTIARIEDGQRPIRLNEANLIAQSFGVELPTMMSDSESASLSLQLVKRRLAEATVYFSDHKEYVDGMTDELEKAWGDYASAQDKRGVSVRKLVEKGLSSELGEFAASFQRFRNVLASVIKLSEA